MNYVFILLDSVLQPMRAQKVTKKAKREPGDWRPHTMQIERWKNFQYIRPVIVPTITQSSVKSWGNHQHRHEGNRAHRRQSGRKVRSCICKARPPRRLGSRGINYHRIISPNYWLAKICGGEGETKETVSLKPQGRLKPPDGSGSRVGGGFKTTRESTREAVWGKTKAPTTRPNVS